MSEASAGSIPAQIAGKLESMPLLSRATGLVLHEAQKDNPDPVGLARIIESDPHLASGVLRFAGSPHHGARWRISTVEQAVGFLGIDAVEAMVVSLTVFEVLSQAEMHSLDFSRHWRHSLAVAAAARAITEKSGRGAAQEAYITGILHDVGRAILDIQAPEESARVLSALETAGGVGVQIERRTLGVDHAGVGEFVLRRWDIPEKIALAVGKHHSEDFSDIPNDNDGPMKLAEVVQAADFAAWSAGLGGTRFAPNLAPAAPVREFLERLDRNMLLDEMEAELARAADLFGVKVPDGRDIRKALAVTSAELGRIRTMHREVEQRLSENSRVLDAVKGLAEAPGKSLGRDDAISAVLLAACSALGCERAAFFRFDERNREFIEEAIEDAGGTGGNISGITQAVGDPSEPFAKAVASGRPFCLVPQGLRPSLAAAADSSTPLRYKTEGDVTGADGILEALGSHEAAAVPVKTGGRVAGLLVVGNPISKTPLRRQALESLSVVAGQTSVALELAHLRQYTQELKAMAETDPLTSLNNRRNLLGLLQAEVNRARRYGKPLSLVMIDIDRFKLFNDTYGHQAGDDVLRMLARLLKNSCRNIDTPGRLGGEEFLVVLPETTLEAAGTYAERVRSLVERLGKRLRNRYPAHALTISVGITSFNQEEDDLDSLVRRVDNAMYSAKKRGKNRICAL